MNEDGMVNPISAEDLEVRRQLEAGNLAVANVLFDELIERNPPPGEDRLSRAVVLVGRAVLAWRLGRIPLALELAAEGWTAIDLARTDDRRTARAIGALGYLTQAVGQRQTSLDLLRLSAKIAGAVGTAFDRAQALQRLGGALNLVAAEQSDADAKDTFAEAAGCLQAGLALEADPRTRRNLQVAYGRSLAGMGQLDRAEEMVRPARAEAGAVGDRWGTAVGNWVLARVRRDQGDLAAARTLGRDALADAEQIRDNALIMRFAIDLAATCAELGDHRTEAAAMRSALAASVKMSETLQEGLAQALDQRKLVVEAQRVAVAAEQAAARDPLTGLANRLGLERAAPLLLAQAGEPGQIAWLVLVDVDQFKGVNDDAGHAAGDATLREIAQLIRRECRAQDLVARWAGDEFVVVLLDGGGNGSYGAGPAVAERIREAVDGHGWSLGLRQAGNPTVSIGVATGSAQLDQLFATADVALYQAKRNGRNRVEIAPEPGSQ